MLQQHLMLVRGVQEAEVVELAVQLETLPVAGVVRICKHRAVGTCDPCDGYCLRPWSALIDRWLTCSKKQYCKDSLFDDRLGEKHELAPGSI